MKLISSLLLILSFSMVSSSIGLAKEIKYNHNSMTIDEVKKEVNFNVLVPEKIPEDWSLEIKTYDYKDKNIRDITLHYMDSNDEFLMLGINERKVSKIEIRQLEEEISNEIKINVNDVKAYYKEWANSGKKLNGNRIDGGLITWIQGDTYVEMDSSILSKDEMVEIARSVR